MRSRGNNSPYLNSETQEELDKAEQFENETKRDCRNCHCFRTCKIVPITINGLSQCFTLDSIPQEAQKEGDPMKFKSPVQWYNLAWICADFIPARKVATEQQKEVTQ